MLFQTIFRNAEGVNSLERTVASSRTENPIRKEREMRVVVALRDSSFPVNR